MKSALLDYSLEKLPLIRKEHSLWVKVLSEAGDKLGQSACVVLSLHYLPRHKAFIVLIALAGGTAINSLLKTLWHEPRPYLLSTAVVPANCKAVEYGLPSGHSMGFILLYRTAIRLVEIPNRRVFEAFILVCSFAVSFNRAEMQVHSFD
jgi:membrane-associated phospholipid phosphatase